jgi:hypothetical protein
MAFVMVDVLAIANALKVVLEDMDEIKSVKLGEHDTIPHTPAAEIVASNFNLDDITASGTTWDQTYRFTVGIYVPYQANQDVNESSLLPLAKLFTEKLHNDHDTLGGLVEDVKVLSGEVRTVYVNNSKYRLLALFLEAGYMNS